MSYVGDDAALRRLVSSLETAGRVPRDARAQIAAIALARVRAGFDDSADPTGLAWAALLYRRGRPLVLTGRLRGSWRARASVGAVVVETSVPYATYHQTGTRFMAARRMLPRDGTLPEAWRAAFSRVIESALARHFGQ